MTKQSRRGLRPLSIVFAAWVPLGCSERQVVQDASIEEHVRRLVPKVEEAAGLEFKSPPVVAVRSKDQVRSYVLAKLDEQLPPEELDGLTDAYELFGMIPDTLPLRSFLLDLYTEQVAGYFDPDSNALYAVAGADPAQMGLVLAHELVHALQAQYASLDSMLFGNRRANDRATAIQALVEGQATFYGVRVLMPEQDLDEAPGFWHEIRSAIRSQQEAMPVFSKAPLVIRESLIFPYLAGADFVRWYERTYPRERLPYGEAAPLSTEQILHPERYRKGDEPVALRFASDPPGTTVTYENELGEFEIRILLAELEGMEAPGTGVPLGWGGDRYRVYDGSALVWYSVWDNERMRDRFRDRLRPSWERAGRRRPEHRATVESFVLDGRAALGVVLAPVGWPGWDRLPTVELDSDSH
jgi:hypothetical protein